MISVYYRVKAGESLSQIAHRYGVEEEVLVRLNRLEGVRFLEEGQQLRIPVKEPVRHRPPKPAPAPSPEPGPWLVLLPGETAGEAARRAGISEGFLFWLNGMAPGQKLYPGQRLRIRP